MNDDSTPTVTPETRADSELSDEANQREQDAARSLKSAMVGVLLCPLQLYTAWLLFLVAFDDERLQPRYFWYAVGAAVILLAHVSLAALLYVLNYLY